MLAGRPERYPNWPFFQQVRPGQSGAYKNSSLVPFNPKNDAEGPGGTSLSVVTGRRAGQISLAAQLCRWFSKSSVLYLGREDLIDGLESDWRVRGGGDPGGGGWIWILYDPWIRPRAGKQTSSGADLDSSP
jgi:hypothetical protein